MKNWKIYLDNTLQKTIELKADFTGVAAGNHELKIEAYNGSTLLDTDVRTISVAGGAYEPETEAYLNELNFLNNSSTSIYGVPNSEVWQRVNDFVLILKDIGITKFHRVFPKIGDSAIKQSVDLITLLRGNYSGSWLYNGTGAVANGTNCYFDTGFNPSTYNVNSIGATISPTSSLSSLSTYGAAMGAFISSTARFEIYDRISTDRVIMYLAGQNVSTDKAMIAAPYTITRNSSNTYYYIDKAVVETDTISGTIPNLNVYEGACNFEGSPDRYSKITMGCTAYHEYLTAAEVNTLHTAMNTLETSLNRK